MEEQVGQHGARPAADVEDRIAAAHLQRAEHAELHEGDCIDGPVMALSG